MQLTRKSEFFLCEALVCPMVALIEYVNHVSCSARRVSIEARLWSLKAVHGLTSSKLHMHWIDDRRWNRRKFRNEVVPKSWGLHLSSSSSNFAFMYCSRQVCMEAHSWPRCSMRVSWSFPCRNLKSIRADGWIRTPIIFWLYRHDAFWAQGKFILSTRQNELLLSLPALQIINLEPSGVSLSILSNTTQIQNLNEKLNITGFQAWPPDQVVCPSPQVKIRVSRGRGCDNYRWIMACSYIFKRQISQSSGRLAK